MKILNIEDEKKVADFIRQGLTETGHSVDTAYSGEAGLDMLGGNSYDLVILDWMLPGMSGLEVCTKLRHEFPELPIIMLTAKDTVDDKVDGLRSGADDYLCKPFSFRELEARIEAVSRRQPAVEVDWIEADDLRVHAITRKVYRGGEQVFLSGREFELLVYLLRHRNQLVTREMIAADVWAIDFETNTNYINVYVNYLRNKLDAGSRRPLIRTIRGQGYILKDANDSEH